MSYLDSNARTASPTTNDFLQPIGRAPILNSVYMAYVKDITDVQKMGRLRVWIPELGSKPNEEQGWIIVNYCSPFAGATNVDSISKSNTQQFDGTQTSYGMWFVPPDINNQVIVMFLNGDPSRGIWIGSLFGQFMNSMVPNSSVSTNNYQYPGKNVPISEYNKWDTTIVFPDSATHPYNSTKFNGVGNQGLITDPQRGATNSSARRESPSQVFGIATPGPAIDPKQKPGNIRRKGGSSFVMDDSAGSESISLVTKSGAQVRIDETNGFVYVINRDGTGWIQIDQAGNIDIFGANDISMRSQGDFNIRADGNVNIESGQNIFMKAAADTQAGTTSFTYNVNNVPLIKTIPTWNYVGEKNGTGGNIVFQANNDWHATALSTIFLTTVNDNINIVANNSFEVTATTGGMDFVASKGIKMSSLAAFDLSTVGDIRIGTNGKLSIVSVSDMVLCTSATLNEKAATDFVMASGNTINLETTTVTIEAGGTVGIEGATLDFIGPSLFSDTVGIVGDFTVKGGSKLSDPLVLGGSNAVTTPPNPDPIPPLAASAAMAASLAVGAEIKPLNVKLNILATWNDPTSKFKRNSQSVQTTVSRFPTFEPCPEHEKFIDNSVAGYVPIITQGATTYDGSAGKANTPAQIPPAVTDPGVNNQIVKGDPPSVNFTGGGAAPASVTQTQQVAPTTSTELNVDALKCQLYKHEGMKLVSYTDSLGFLTGGVGHLIRDNELSSYPVGTPISQEKVDLWFATDSGYATGLAHKAFFEIWADLSEIRKRAIIDLIFNLGLVKAAKFGKFTAAMKRGDYQTAGQELANSVYATQVPSRAKNLITMIVNNIDPLGCDKANPQ